MKKTLKSLIAAIGATLMMTGSAFAADVAKIADTPYATFAEALNAAKAMTGSVTVEIYEKVTLDGPLSGNFSSISFVGKDTDAEIYLDIQGAIYASDKTVSFADISLSKSQGGYVADAGFRNLAFGIFAAKEVNYVNCKFINGAYASSGKATFTNCTFYPSHDRYGLWVYGDVECVVDGCTFDATRGIKLYAEGLFKTNILTVKNTDFSGINNKPAIVLCCAESVTLEDNTYSSTGVFELDLDGVPNGTTVTSDVPPTCINDNGACGVLVDGKIYTTVAQAAEVATSASTVTLLHNSAETVELPEGVTLDKNGFTADGVTVKQPAKNIEVTDANGNVTYYAGFTGFSDLDLADCTIKLLNNVSDANLILNKGSTSKIVDTNVTLDLNGYTFSRTGSSSGAISLTQGSGLTIRDSSDAKTGKILVDTYAIWIMNGDFVLESGTIETTSTKNAAIYANAAEVAINDGKIISAGDAITVGENFMESRGASTIAISGGEIVAAGVGIKNGSYAQDSTAVTVTGGTIDSEGDSINMEKGSAQVSGGTFSSDVSDYCVDGYESKKNADGTYGVVVATPAVAKIGDTPYTTLEAAFNAAKAGDTVEIVVAGNYELKNNYVEEGAYRLPDNFTLKGMVDGVVVTNGPTIRANNLTIDNVDFNNPVQKNYQSGLVFYLTGDSVIKNSDIYGYWGASYYSVVKGTLLVDNCTFDTQVYGLHIAEGNADVTVKNSVIAGWNTYGSDIRVTFTGCTFKDNRGYHYLGFYGDAVIEDCKFEENVTIGSQTADAIVIDISNSKVVDDNGDEIAEKSIYDIIEQETLDSDVVVKIDNIHVNGKVAKIGETTYATLADALAAAQAGDTVELLADASVDGTAEIPAGITIKSNGNKILGSIRMLGDLTLDGKLEITGGLWVGKSGETLDAALEGDKLTAMYFMFQRGNYTINADIDAVYGYLSYEAQFDVNSTITTTNTNGEPLYLNGKINLNEGASFVVKYLYLSYADTILTVKKGASIVADSGVALTAVGAKLYSAGDILAPISAIDGASVSLTGGTYTQDVKDWCAEGYLCAEQNSDPVLWKVGRLPSAEVVNLGPVEVGPDGDFTFGDNYYVYDLVGTQKMTTSSEPFDLQIALDFIAKDTVAQASNNAFGNYTTDFYITINGIENGQFVADEDCYLAGYYPSFNAWVKIPLTGFKIEDGKVYPVITSAGFDFKYTDICGSVGDFICGIHLSDAVLQANPALKVKLELGLSKTYDDALAADKFVGVDQPYEYDVEDMTSAVAVVGPDYYTTVKGAVDVALQTGDFVKLVLNADLDDNLAVESDLVLNLGGNTLTANGKTLAVTDSVVTITNGTLSGFTKDNVTLAGNAVLTVTDKNVADSFRQSDSHYVSANANGTYSIVLKSAFRVFITVVDGEPRIGFFKDHSALAPAYTLLGATSLENPEWKVVNYIDADDAAGASTLPLYWSKLDQAADDANVYRFFKIGPASAAE